MGLSRLSNFIKSIRGTILYVDPSSLDSTDSIENSGNSLTRPFKTIQRALIESVKFSYQSGQNNDRFNKTTILVYPGDHPIDNRPGYIPLSSSSYLKRGGEIVTDLTQWDLNTTFDLTNSDNALYKMNSIHGGVIVPRGVSIVGMDLRKTKIRPLYVPDPENNNIERSCVFRVTGGCYFWQFTFLDANPNGNCYKNYTNSLFVPNFSHHKLSCFEYADGVNGVYINDAFINGSNTVNVDRTDLDMYYEKVAAVYQEIQPNYGSGVIDIQPVVDEYRIVGSKGRSVGISSIRAGGGTLVTATNTITVNLEDSIPDLSVDTPIQISGVDAVGYDGQYVIASVNNSKQLTYRVQNVPINPSPSSTNATLNIVVDTVTSTSPYIFNLSLRSVYGMCGLLADGDKATGFKSMVVAQFTGIGLQKDENAFTKYNESTGEYEYSDKISNLHTNSRSKFKPSYENFHIKATNDSFLQLVSIFAIGYAQHFVTENGGDIALNNSNSNFGAKSLVSTGFKRDAFSQDDSGYITHIIPPKEIESDEISIEFVSIDVGLTTSKSAGAATTDRLYLYNETSISSPPKVLLNNYHVGARVNDKLHIQSYVNGITTSYSSNIVMPCGGFNSTKSSSEKSFTVGRNNVGINSIGVDGSDVLTLTESHSFINGESVQIFSSDGHLPDGIKVNTIYYVISNGTLGSDKIKLAKTLNDALNLNAITLNDKGGVLTVVSRVSDKNSGDIGHPVQWDTSGNWYINVSDSENNIYNAIKNYGVNILGSGTSRSYVRRKPNNRNLIDTLYRVRYVIPKDSQKSARPPVDGFILQESNNIIGSGDDEISQLFNFTTGSISSSSQLRKTNFIADASYLSGVATIRTELRHDLKVGDTIEILNVTSTNNISGSANLGYNGTYVVTSTPSAKEFKYSLSLNPGIFTNDTSSRTIFLPYFKRKKYEKVYQIYRTKEVQEYISNVQDGIYYLTLINYSNKPSVTPFTSKGYAQPVINLYPQVNNDNPNSDPNASSSYAMSDIIGQVEIDNPQNSITKETLEYFAVGYGITNVSSSSGIAHTIYTSVDHGLSAVRSVSIVNSGTNYGSGSSGVLYNAKLVDHANSLTGSNATAKITLGPGGGILSVNIIDGGSAYGIGNTLAVVGVATTSGHVIGVVKVESVTDNTNDTIQISGITSFTEYNNIYRVSNVSVGKPKEINVISSETINNYAEGGVGNVLTLKSGYSLTGKSLQVSSFTYDSSTGFATIQFNQSHGFLVDQKIKIYGANEEFFNGNFIVKKVNSLVSLVIDVGSGYNSISATGSIYAYRPYLSSYGGDLVNDTENTSGRLVYEYGGITASLASQLTSQSNSNQILIVDAVNLGFTLGDYLLINNEIFRINSAVTSDSISVFRSVLGSPRQTHVIGSVVRRIKVKPVELRRNSIIRASGHTFEYLGFGPGNYSTSLPEKQDRIISNYEKFLAQSTKSDGGIVVYTGMNAEGDFFAGNKKINSVTGKEETFDTPFPTFTGEREINDLVNITETQKIFVTNSIRVEGGKDKNTVSQFDGPVIFSNKITTNNDVEANNVLIQGNESISRKFSISNSKPNIVGSYGDIVFNSVPTIGENVGWVYVTDNSWTEFGTISPLDSTSVGIFNQVAISTYSPVDSLLRIGAGSSLVVVDRNGNIGVGETPGNYKLKVNGNLYANYLYGDGSNLTNLNTPATGWSQVPNGLYNTSLTNVGIGTTNPTSKLSVLGDVNISGIVTASQFSGNFNTTSGISTFSNLIISGIVTASNFIGNLTGTATTATNVRGGIGSLTSLYVSGISTLGTVLVSSGIVTATTPTGIVTYYGDGGQLSNIKAKLDSNFNFIVGGGCTTGFNNNLIGQYAGQNATGRCNNFFGCAAGYAAKGCHNNFFGTFAGYGNLVTASDNNFFGCSAGYGNGSGCRNNFFGKQSGYNFGTGSDNVFIGSYSGFNNSSGSHNVYIGTRASCTNNSGNYNVVIGAGRSTPILNGSNQLTIGSQNNNWIVGNSSYNVGVGTTNPTSKLHVNGNVKVNGSVTADSFVFTSAQGTIGIGTTQTVGVSTNSIKFTSIPDYVKKIHIVFSDLTSSTSADILVRLGTSSGISNTGYKSSSSTDGGNSTDTIFGFIIANNVSSGIQWSGIIILATIGDDTWASMGTLYPQRTSSGRKVLSSKLTQIEIMNNTFTGGKINILYEG